MFKSTLIAAALLLASVTSALADTAQAPVADQVQAANNELGMGATAAETGAVGEGKKDKPVEKLSDRKIGKELSKLAGKEIDGTITDAERQRAADLGKEVERRHPDAAKSTEELQAEGKL